MITTFFSEKGGSGKTTFNILYASFLAYHLQRNVLYIDIDFPNFHAEGIRLRELKLFKDYSPNLKRYITTTKAYDIQKIADIRNPANCQKAIALLRDINCMNKYDHIIIDFPGTLDNPSVKQLLISGLIENIYTPIEEDNQLIWSALRFAKGLQEAGSRPPVLFWNRIFSQEKSENYDLRTKFITKQYSVQVLNTRIKNSVRIRREWEGANSDFIRSTLCYPLRNIAQSNLNCITELFTEITNRQHE